MLSQAIKQHPVTIAAICALSAIISAAQAGPLSVTSTSQGHAKYTSRYPYTPVPSVAFKGDGAHSVIVSNDLGMHCADLDSRIAIILPPFNVLHAQVLLKGTKPTLLNDAQATVLYSAVSNPSDPVINRAQTLAPNGSVFKSNFWSSIAAYNAFYPNPATPTNPGLANYFPPGSSRIDLGLPVPDVARLYLGDGQLDIHSQTNTSVSPLVYSSTSGLLRFPSSFSTQAYTANIAQPFRSFEASFPMFSGHFANRFGYIANKTNWFAAEGIPVAPFDDYGRENPFPMMRVQAVNPQSPSTVYATTDVVVPVSGETTCKGCHLPSSPGNGLATKSSYGITWKTAADDPAYKNGSSTGSAPKSVAEEWAADVNILMLHDYLHPLSNGLAGKKLFSGYDATTGRANSPVACQTCHYTPALDLIQLGPQGTDSAPVNNVASTAPVGLMQQSHETMSRVMHYRHNLKTNGGTPIFASMPSPDKRTTTGDPTSPISAATETALNKSCYQCHPGQRTKCLRGAMYSQAGSVCQDCHGDMNQIGDDFSKTVLGGGGFVVAADYYTNSQTPRVPWLNEPGCGSCHTGDANSNFVSQTPASKKVIAAQDSIRLLQAYFADDPAAKPIVPTNRRFAEPVVASGSASGNPQLFRLSVDTHGGVFCEGCHGATHAEFPVGNGGATFNDNVTSQQLQGHTGKLMECNACHTGTSMSATLKGPHGMHPVGNNGFSARWVSGHGDFAEHNMNECRACHGTTGLGTPLAEVAATRTGLKCERTGPRPGMPPCSNESITLPAGYKVTCDTCHSNKAVSGGN